MRVIKIIFALLAFIPGTSLKAQPNNDQRVAESNKKFISGKLVRHDSSMYLSGENTVVEFMPPLKPQGLPYSSDNSYYPVAGKTFDLLHPEKGFRLDYYNFNSSGRITRFNHLPYRDGLVKYSDYIQLNDTCARVEGWEQEGKSFRHVSRFDKCRTGDTSTYIIYRRAGAVWERDSLYQNIVDEYNYQWYTYRGKYDPAGILVPVYIKQEKFNNSYQNTYTKILDTVYTIYRDTFFRNLSTSDNKRTSYIYVEGRPEVRASITVYKDLWPKKGLNRSYNFYSANGTNFYRTPGTQHSIDSIFQENYGWKVRTYLLDTVTSKLSLFEIRYTDQQINDSTFSFFRLRNYNGVWDTAKKRLEIMANLKVRIIYYNRQNNSLKFDSAFAIHYDSLYRIVFRQFETPDSSTEARYYYEPFSGRFNELDKGLSIILYPVPAQDDIFFKLNKPVSAATITMWNANGQPVLNKTLDKGDLFELDLSNIPPGFYIYQFRTFHESHTGRFVKY